MLLHVSAISIACLVGFAVEEQQLAELTKLKKYFLKKSIKDVRENNHLEAFRKAVLCC